jgi:hypothetical protein
MMVLKSPFYPFKTITCTYKHTNVLIPPYVYLEVHGVSLQLPISLSRSSSASRIVTYSSSLFSKKLYDVAGQKARIAYALPMHGGLKVSSHKITEAYIPGDRSIPLNLYNLILLGSAHDKAKASKPTSFLPSAVLSV